MSRSSGVRVAQLRVRLRVKAGPRRPRVPIPVPVPAGAPRAQYLSVDVGDARDVPGDIPSIPVELVRRGSSARSVANPRGDTEGSVDESVRRFSYRDSYVPKCMVLAIRRVSRISRSVSLKSSTRWYIPGPRRASSSLAAEDAGAGDRGDRPQEKARPGARVLSACAPTDESTTAVLVAGARPAPARAPPARRRGAARRRSRRAFAARASWRSRRAGTSSSGARLACRKRRHPPANRSTSTPNRRLSAPRGPPRTSASHLRRRPPCRAPFQSRARASSGTGSSA